MSKIISGVLTVAVALTMAGFGLFLAVPVSAATIVDGDVVSPDASFTDADGLTYHPYDVFIIKLVGDKKFKRLVLNPQVFDSYGHLSWSNIKKVSADTLKTYVSSTLVRPIDDEEVYNLIPDGDTGTKKWVESLDCFRSQNYDWSSVYIINAIDKGNYSTDAGTVCGSPDVTGDMILSLASDNPAASTLPTNAQGVTFMSIRVAGTGTLNQLTLKRLGAGDTGDFGDIYIYENGVRLTSGRALSSSTSKVTFINLGIKAPTTIQIVADLSTATAGDVNYFGIESASDVTADATVSGTFPLNGNPMGIGGTAGGTLTVAVSGSSARNVTIGAQNVEITQFKVTASTEGTNLQRIKLFNSGTASNELITNLVLKDNAGVTVTTATKIGSDGYVDFIISPAYYIKKGDSEIFRVFANVGAVKPDRTITLYLELSTDILGVGTTYGFGMAATVTSYASGSLVTITCKGGDLTLNKIGPNANNVGTKTSDTVFLEYTVSAAADITIKRTRLVFCIDYDGNGTYLASTSAGADITDIKIVDKDSGTVVAGPKDGTSFNDGTSAICPSSGTGMYEDFTDTIDVVSGETKTYQVTADIDTSATDSGANIAAADIVEFILSSYASLVGTSGNVSYMKYAGTTDAVDDSAIAPSGHIAGESMTIAAPSLAITLAASPAGGDVTADEKVYIAGQGGVDAVGFIFTAGNASDVTINSIQLTAYTAEATGVALAAGIDTNYVKDSISIVRAIDKDTGAQIPGSGEKGFTSGTNFENTDYTGLSWTIPAGESKTLLVNVDVSSAAPASASTADTWIGFDIVDISADVTAIDEDGNSVTGTGDASNPLAATVNFGIADYGSLTIDNATDTPDKSLVVMGTNDNEISKFKLTGTNEAWNIETFSIVLDDGGGIDPEDRDNFSAVKVKYQTMSQWDSDNWTISSGKTFGATASLAFSFSGDNRIYVPKDDDSFVTVLVSIPAYSNTKKSKVPFKMYDLDGSTSSLKAYGAQSGKLLTSYTTDSAAAADFNLHFVTRSKPVFAKVAWSGAEAELARFSITAVGYNVVFDGTAGTEADYASAALRFDILASSTDAATGDLTLYDWNENVLSSAGTVTWGDGTLGSVSFVFEEKDATITAGLTREFHIDLGSADISGDFLKTDEYVYLQLRNDDGGDVATGSMSFGARDIVYGDETNEEGISGQGDPESRFGMPAFIKNIGSIPITFRTLRGTATP